MSGEDSGASDGSGGTERAASPEFDGDLADLEAELEDDEPQVQRDEVSETEHDEVSETERDEASETERDEASGVQRDGAGESGNNEDVSAEPGAPDDSTRSAPDGETVELQVRSHLLSAWRRQANQAKLSLSEYLVHMVEAGRMSVTMQPTVSEDTRSTMTIEEVADHIREELEHDEYVSWEGLVETFVDDLEQTVEEALSDLQEEGVVRYSGLHGGYQLTDRTD